MATRQQINEQIQHLFTNNLTMTVGELMTDISKLLSLVVDYANNDKTEEQVIADEWYTLDVTPQFKKVPVIATNLKTLRSKYYESISVASKVLGIPYQNIYNCVRNKQKTTYGFSFKTCEEKNNYDWVYDCT